MFVEHVLNIEEGLESIANASQNRGIIAETRIMLRDLYNTKKFDEDLKGEPIKELKRVPKRPQITSKLSANEVITKIDKWKTSEIVRRIRTRVRKTTGLSRGAKALSFAIFGEKYLQSYCIRFGVKASAMCEERMNYMLQIHYKLRKTYAEYMKGVANKIQDTGLYRTDDALLYDFWKYYYNLMKVIVLIPQVISDANILSQITTVLVKSNDEKVIKEANLLLTDMIRSANQYIMALRLTKPLTSNAFIREYEGVRIIGFYNTIKNAAETPDKVEKFMKDNSKYIKGEPYITKLLNRFDYNMFISIDNEGKICKTHMDKCYIIGNKDIEERVKVSEEVDELTKLLESANF
jgi:hypothetical protein